MATIGAVLGPGWLVEEVRELLQDAGAMSVEPFGRERARPDAKGSLLCLTGVDQVLDGA